MTIFIMQSVHADTIANHMNEMYGDYGRFVSSKGDVGFISANPLNSSIMLEIKIHAFGFSQSLDDCATLRAQNAELREALRDMTDILVHLPNDKKGNEVKTRIIEACPDVLKKIKAGRRVLEEANA